MKHVEGLLLYFSLVIAIVATMGSLFFSEVMNFYPCVMCWYQRIFMYPLVFLFLVACWKNDTKVVKYSLPLVLIGLLFSIYHLSLYFGFLPEAAAPCVEGVSCTTTYIQWFGFITIPMLSFTAFSLLLFFQILLLKRIKNGIL